MRLYLARCPETKSEEKGLILGQMDAPLTDYGKKVANQLGVLMAGENLSLILSSPQGRAVTTSRLISANQPGEKTRPVVIADGLAELSCGQWEKKPRTETLEDPRTIRRDWGERPPGGESYYDGEARVWSVVEQLRAMKGSGQILLVGHPEINIVFLKLWLELTQKQAVRIRQPQGAIYVLNEERLVRQMDATLSNDRDRIYRI